MCPAPPSGRPPGTAATAGSPRAAQPPALAPATRSLPQGRRGAEATALGTRETPSYDRRDPRTEPRALGAALALLPLRSLMGGPKALQKETATSPAAPEATGTDPEAARTRGRGRCPLTDTLRSLRRRLPGPARPRSAPFPPSRHAAAAAPRRRRAGGTVWQRRLQP